MPDCRFFVCPPTAPDVADFRFGDKGAHTSRTMMLAELGQVLSAVPESGSRRDYVDAVVEGNATAKATSATRRATLKRLSELYGLDPRNTLFRALRRACAEDPKTLPLLALECALARDPRFRQTAALVIGLPEGADLGREALKATLRDSNAGRLNEASADKVARNAASSWTQSGHLTGRTFKHRKRVVVGAAAAAYAAYLSHLAGFRGFDLFTSCWFAVLDLPPDRAREAVLEARRMGLLDVRIAADVVAISFDRLIGIGREQ